MIPKAQQELFRTLRTVLHLKGDSLEIGPTGFPEDIATRLGIKGGPNEIVEGGLTRELYEMLRIANLTIGEAAIYHQLRWKLPTAQGFRHELAHLILGLAEIPHYQANAYMEIYTVPTEDIIREANTKGGDFSYDPPPPDTREAQFVESVHHHAAIWKPLVEGWRTIRYILQSGGMSYRNIKKNDLLDSGKGFEKVRDFGIEFLDAAGNPIPEDGSSVYSMLSNGNWRIRGKATGNNIYTPQNLPTDVEAFNDPNDQEILSYYGRIEPYLRLATKLQAANGISSGTEPDAVKIENTSFRDFVVSVRGEDKLPPPLTTTGAADPSRSQITHSSNAKEPGT